MSCRITQCRVAPRLKVNERLADQILLAVSTCVLQNRRIPGCTQGSKFARFGRPVVAVSTHTHECCSICQFTAAPNNQGLRGLRRPSAAASIHMCIAEIRVAPRSRKISRASPTNCGCEHTHVCRKTSTSNQGSATHMCVLPAEFGRPAVR